MRALAAVAAQAGLAILALDGLLTAVRAWRRGTRQPPLELRVRNLQESLRQSAELVAELQQELLQRAATLERLRREEEMYRTLISMNIEQAQAIGRIMRFSSLGTEKRARRLAIWIAILTLVVGAVLHFAGVPT
jgi:hypothetical protein